MYQYVSVYDLSGILLQAPVQDMVCVMNEVATSCASVMLVMQGSTVSIRYRHVRVWMRNPSAPIAVLVSVMLMVITVTVRQITMVSEFTNTSAPSRVDAVAYIL